MRLGNIYLGTLDIQGGAFTYGNRIAIGQIFNDGSLTEYQRLKAAHKELYGYSCRWLPLRRRYKRLMAIVEGVSYWCQIEAQELAYTPTADEIAAGIDDLRKKVGDLATIEAIAEKFSKDPDEVLQWSYSKVFGFLRTDLLRNKYMEKYHKQTSKRNGANTKYRR